jgi:hypothetical protein
MPKKTGWRIELKPWHWIAGALTSVTVLAGGIAALSDLEPYFLAHRGYVIMRVSDQGKVVTPVLNQLNIRLLRGQIQSLQSQEERAWGEQLTLKRDLKRTTDEEVRDLLEERIERLLREIKESSKARERLQEQIDKLQ